MHVKPNTWNLAKKILTVKNPLLYSSDYPGHPKCMVFAEDDEEGSEKESTVKKACRVLTLKKSLCYIIYSINFKYISQRIH